MTTKEQLESGPSFRSLGPNVPDTTINKTELSINTIPLVNPRKVKLPLTSNW